MTLRYIPKSQNSKTQPFGRNNIFYYNINWCERYILSCFQFSLFPVLFPIVFVIGQSLDLVRKTLGEQKKKKNTSRPPAIFTDIGIIVSHKGPSREVHFHLPIQTLIATTEHDTFLLIFQNDLRCTTLSPDVAHDLQHLT